MTELFHRAIATLLAGAGQRYTPHRRAVVEALAGSTGPITAEELSRRGTPVPLSTLYRSLALLAELGVVRKVAGRDETMRFELAEEVTGHHHHHLVCSGCGTVSDVAPDPELEAALGRAATRAADHAGFRSVEHRIDLVGLCSRCN